MLTLLRRLGRAFAWAGAAVALAIACTTAGSVMLRALTTRPIQGDVEITQFGIALALSLMLPWCQLRSANIIVDFFTQRLRERRLRLLDGAGCLLIAVMYLLLAWRTGVGARAVYEAGEVSMIRSWPMWWVYVSLAPGLALAGVIALVQAALHFQQRPLAALQGQPDPAA
jgi:TRAP-type C4-dicarboxylate transport system permease small subunit